MNRLQAFKFQLRADGDQERQMRRFAGACRFVFNKGLALQKARYAAGEKKLGYAGLCKELTAWRNSAETAWLAEAPIHPLQQTLKDLERAYANFFAKRAELPRFKKKGKVRRSFRYPDPLQVKHDDQNARLFLPKLGWLRYRKSRAVLGTIKNITVSEHGNRWHVSIQTEREVETPRHPSTSIVGIDLGVVRFATLSDGTVVEPVSCARKQQVRLAGLQRAMNRKKKFSKNWRKAKARVSTLHARIGDARQDYLHKTSTAISKNHAIVCIEDLRVRNMSASAGGTKEVPGRNVRAKAGLNRSILDQGWFEFRRQLEYKQGWRGGEVIAVPPQNTSRTCPACGHVAAENRTSQARFACTLCGHEANADLVGAINILRAGHARLACGESVQSDRSVKQEPPEATRAAHAA